jgi:nucleotide-binding universal stress UspA family protein
LKVLLGLDGFKPSIEAMALLRKIGNVSDLKVTLASVTPTGVLAPEHLLLALDPIEVRRQASVDIVDNGVSTLLADGFKATGAVLEGGPGKELVSFISKEWFDVSIIGTGRRTWLGSILLGSTSSYLLHNSPSSVLVVHRAPMESDKAQILVATDGSRGAEFGMSAVLGLVDPDKVQITTISVGTTPDPLVASSRAATAQSGKQSAEDILMERAQHHARTATQRITDAGFDVSSRAVVGSPAEAILREINNIKADLVVVGSRGTGPLRQALMGSVSDAVVRHAPATLVGRRHSN